MSDASTKGTYRELVTIDGKNVVLAHNEPPVMWARARPDRHGIFFTGLGSSP
jgi:hypothetical protein